MRKSHWLPLAGLALVATTWYVVRGSADEKKLPAEENKAIKQTLEAFALGFNSGDAAKAAAVFAADAEFIDDRGNGVRGRAAIEKLFAGFLEKNKGAKVQLTLEEPRLLTPDVVLQDGESVITVPDKSAQTSRRYTIVFVRQDKNFVVASLREFPEESETAEAANRLKDLEWMIGDWIDEGDNGLVVTSCRWSDDKRYLLRDYTVKMRGKDALKGTQRVGIDPLTGQIKGWTFDSQNGYGETTWIKNGEEWLIKATGITGDGEAASATYILKPAGKSKFVWKMMHRVIGERVEPDAEVTIVRRPSSPK
jgi:uncharacterized protein (TIGR02246 family)